MIYLKEASFCNCFKGSNNLAFHFKRLFCFYNNFCFLFGLSRWFLIMFYKQNSWLQNVKTSVSFLLKVSNPEPTCSALSLPFSPWLTVNHWKLVLRKWIQISAFVCKRFLNCYVQIAEHVNIYNVHILYLYFEVKLVQSYTFSVFMWDDFESISTPLSKCSWIGKGLLNQNNPFILRQLY